MPTSRSGPTKQERVYKEVRERILAGTYVPGFRIVIDALAEEFGVSALPVREAIRRLEAEGLVIFRPNVGAQVAPAEPGRLRRGDVGPRGARGLRDRGGGPVHRARRAATAHRDHRPHGGRDGVARHPALRPPQPRVPRGDPRALPERGARRARQRRDAPARRDPPHRVRADPLPRRRIGRRAPRAHPAAGRHAPSGARSRPRRASTSCGTVESFRAWRAQQDADAMPLGGTARLDA